MSESFDDTAQLDTILWVPVVWSGPPEGWYPDVPRNISYSAEIPSEIDPSLSLRTKPGNLDPSKHLGDPAVKCCRIRVRTQDVPKIINAIAELDVSDKDKRLIELEALFHPRP